ncbi:glutamate-cysteine ligase catalytic subunit [Naegleria gruberi]|uniref:Glutamate--cysteine ligase n=1 Tax=Naegleria gruberi TaxID=5762 RepID=D2V9N8_NAEGR|nr:glutamate-cysteine ligase catalytic subunit [Naegleria gruberi]EFC46617.1 glutamate-cysteine ligase catalytic subunit [Naegleria gruberi]|eukprot:XP_002679361.1 glutamate-cysteine ligase catalytic subunit [Naegleria gruberi strain NEG-M]
MGLLKAGTPLKWTDALSLIDYVKEHGIKQFIIIYNKVKDRTDKELKWGDEIEYLLLEKDSESRQVYLSLHAKQVLDVLMKEEEDFNSKLITQAPLASWKPEYGRFMLEGTPFFPYEGCISCYLKCEESMQKRRMIAQSIVPKILQQFKSPNVTNSVITMSLFPLLGATSKVLNSDINKSQFNKIGDILPLSDDESNEMLTFNGPIARSPYIPDIITNEHPRFGTLTRNIRLRRGKNVNILVPLYIDENTNVNIGKQVHHLDNITSSSTTSSSTLTNLYPNIDEIIQQKKEQVLSSSYAQRLITDFEHFIHMDAMAFGMGCCCMQSTLLARDIHEARNLYDQMAVLCPIMLALTAATPMARGLLADTDVRWNIVSASVDDRRDEENNTISKSRYDSISLYIGENEQAKQFSDLEIEIDEQSYNTLRENNIDEQLSRHIAHYFIRDPLVIFTDCKQVDDENESVHFENLQSTNWQTVRFKPPPGPNSSIGWRVEFRVMEVQLTDFENAAFTVFIVLLTRAILSFKLNMLMPLSQVDENMKKAHLRDAVLNQKFSFRTCLDSDLNSKISSETFSKCTKELTINEIMNGVQEQDKKFIGLIPLVRKYLDQMHVEVNDRIKLERYLNLVSLRASGKLQTNAAFIRQFIRNHQNYQKDSVITQDIAFDLIEMAEKISTYEFIPDSLLGGFNDFAKTGSQ